jgi:hypothetical protein
MEREGGMRKRLAIGTVMAAMVALAACDGTAGTPTTATASKKPKVTSSTKASPKASPKGSATPGPDDEGDSSPSPKASGSPSPGPTSSGSPSPGPSPTASGSVKPSTSPSPTPTASGSVKPSTSPSPTPTTSVKPSTSPSPSPSPTPSATGSAGSYAAVFTVGKKFTYNLTVETAGASAINGTLVWEVLAVEGNVAEIKSTTTLPGQAPSAGNSQVDLSSSNPFGGGAGQPTPGPPTTESVTVPAGTFECTKTRSAGTLPDGQGELESGDVWFNTTQGMVKQLTKTRLAIPGFPTGILSTNTIELKSIE